MAFHPYLFFSGDCRAAFTRYQEVLGGELDIMTMGDLPPGADDMPGAEAHHVMHAALTTADGLLMGSDDPTGDGGAKVGLCVHYTAPSDGAAREAFDALSEGGEVTMAFEPQFWTPGFGACTDRFGVPWMISAPEVEDAQQAMG